ncbi:MAG: SRPBCC family protein [Phycisphaeraceae bacterium]|nr:SRPBCC family protein [Phycisphaeraceae bacterium]
MATNTIRLHRVLKAPPDRVYRAFIDPGAMCKWMPPDGYTGTVHSMDAKVGGGYRMSFTNFTTGYTHSFGGTYIEMKEGESLKYSDKFDDPNLPGEMRVTVTFKKVSCGTELTIVHEGLPEIIPPETCCVGWQESMSLLARLVEPELKDGM